MLAWIAAVALSAPRLEPESVGDSARRALGEGRFFDLKALAPSHPKTPEESLYRGIVLAGLNRLPEAIDKLQSAAVSLRGDPRETALENLVSCLARAGRYAEAEQAAKRALRECKGSLTSDERDDFRNSSRLFGAIRHVPPMKVVGKSPSRFMGPSRKQFELSFTSGGSSFALGADTGANLSLVREGLGKRMGLRMIRTRISVGSITGDKSQPWLGVAKELTFGSVKVRNAVFLVMRDRDLYFPEAKFQLDGVIGLPILMELQPLTFYRNGVVETSGERLAGGPPNLFVSGLSLLVSGTFKGKELAFALDSGAGTTLLYPPFARKFASEINAKGFPKTTLMRGGAGGKNTASYLLLDVPMGFAGRNVLWPEIDVISEARGQWSKTLFGHVGRDLYRQFESVTFDWKSMRLTLGTEILPK